MKCGEIDLEAFPATDDDDEEMEAAEALTGMAHGGSLPRELEPPSHQDRANATQQFCNYASTTATTTTTSTNPEKGEHFVEKIPGTSCQLNSMAKSRPKLSQAEKEERKIRRVLANRESARQTIRRRKAMHLELTRKVAEVLEENETLKKGRVVAVDKHNSLKSRNEFLKAKLAEAQKAVRGTQEEPAVSSFDHACPSTTPFFMHHQPPTVPYMWPRILQSSEAYQFQCAPRFGSSSSSHFPMPYPCMMPCSQQGQQPVSMKTNSQGPQLLVVAVPWLLPCLAPGAPSNFNSSCASTQNSQSNLLHNDNCNHLSSNGNTTRVTAISAGPVEVFGPSRNARGDTSCGACVRAAPEMISHDLFHKKQEPLKNPEDALAASVARRRRKELMKMKTSHCYSDHLRYSDTG